MSEVVIKAENISKYYKLGQINTGYFFRDLQEWISRKKKEVPAADSGQDGFWALKDIDFEIKQGDRIGLIGKNGAGKSTLLKIISEITAPTTGSVKIKGRVASLLEVGTGFHQEMTGRENIYMNGAILGMSRKEITDKLDEIIEFSGIEQHIDTPVKRYSSGMYVRLAFAVAAHLESEILIADEVLAVGDASFQKKALEKMGDLSSKEGRTVLFVSHNMSAVKGICNKGILLDKGRITHTGEMQEVINAYFDNPFMKDEFDLKEKINELPDDPSFRFHHISVTQNGKEVNRFVGNASPIDIRLEYELLTTESGFRVYYDICDSGGELLCRSFNDEQGEGMSKVLPGRYVSKTSIPANFLGPTDYILVIRSTIFNVRSCTGDGIKIPLSVVQDGIYNQAYPNDTFRGKLGVVMKWENHKI
ncbi:MAG: ABC transporter ATP-binding protein [Lachnospiraceae bacterium]|nr:ABC transporter ATP-binding protein [Lachnospiraceae bacterium]